MLEVTPEEKQQVMSIYNVDEKRVKESIEIIKTWTRKHPYLPEDIPDNLIEKLLSRNKFSIERTKQRLDNYYLLRSQNRNLIEDFGNVVPSKEPTLFLPLPKLTPKCERVIIMKLLNFDPELYDTANFIKLNLAVIELLLQYDTCIGIRFLIDFENFSLKHLTKWNSFLLKQHATLMEEAYSCRILGIQIINFPTCLNKVLALLKIILRPKIYDRVKVHPFMESLYNVIPKQCLPSEYGGSCSNMTEMIKKLDEEMENHKYLFLEKYEQICQVHLSILERNDAFGHKIHK